MKPDARVTDEALQTALATCVRCGSCKSTCPTYDAGHDETVSGRGRIVILHALLSGDIRPSRSALDRIFSCLQCGACSGSCPSGIDVPEILYAARKHLNALTLRRAFLPAMSGIVLRYPDLAFRIARGLGGPLTSVLKNARIVPGDFSLPEQSLRDLPQVITPSRKKGRVAVFLGCSVTYLFPHLGHSLLRVLSRLGYEVILPRGEVCCGVPFRTLGREEEAREHAQKNFRLFSRLNTDAVLSLCPTCVVALRSMYPRLIDAGMEHVMDITEFLVRAGVVLPAPRAEIHGFYHDPCHLVHALKICEEPRSVLRQCGVIPAAGGPPRCCGFGGTYSLRFRNRSMAFAESLHGIVERTQSTRIYTACPGCVFQLKKVEQSREVLHIIEAVDRAYA